MTNTNMKRLCNFIAVLILLTACGYSLPTYNSQVITGNIKTDINNFLPAGKITVDIMDGVKSNTRQEGLTIKFQMGIQQNYEWFVDYMKTVPEGEPMPYHQNLGLTEEEYMELQGYLNDIEIVSTGKSDIIIKKEGDIIQFKGSKKLEVLGTVKIDLAKNIVTIGKYELAFSDSVNVTDEKNALKSKWRGYTWRLEEPKDMDLNALKDLQTLKAKQYKFSIGRLEKNGKTFMSLKGQVIENGVRQVNFDLPLIF